MPITRKELNAFGGKVRILRIKDGESCLQFRPRPERNGKCPCGSGRKYKKCCLNKGVEK
jgi:uncharacterized protein YecA (UPF0149 family)